MELGLDLKITKTRHDMTSIMSDFHFAKGTVGPVFFSEETDSKFILNAHLKGYKRKNIEIKISEDGSELWVSGEKTVQEMTMMPLKMKTEEEVKMIEFKEMFRIPEGVVLDGIKASYNGDEWMLTIVMPKMVKGIVNRVGIEEEEEEEEADKGRREEEEEEDPSEVDQEVKKEEEFDEKPEEAREQSVGDEVQKQSEEKETRQEMKKKRPRKPRKPCFPLMFGGSTFLVCLIVIVIHYLRLRHK